MYNTKGYDFYYMHKKRWERHYWVGNIYNVYTMSWKLIQKDIKRKGKCALSTLCMISCFPPTWKDISNFVLTCQKIIAETIFLLIFCLCLRIYIWLLTCLEDAMLQKLKLCTRNWETSLTKCNEQLNVTKCIVK